MSRRSPLIASAGRLLRNGAPLALALALGTASPASAQQFLLTVGENDQHFLALVDSASNVLATTVPGPVLGPGRFYPGERWASFDGDQVLLYDAGGAQVGSVNVTNGWNSMAVFPGGRIAIREPWGTSKVFVHDTNGAVLSSWPFDPCPAGPDYGMRVEAGDEVWLASYCGSFLRRYDVSGVLLGELLIPGGVTTTWDDSCDDFAAAADGTFWVWQGYQPATIARYGWDGTLLASFPTEDAVSGLGVAADGSVWVLHNPSHALLRYDEAGVSLGSVTLPPTWHVWSFDLRDGGVGEPFCVANPNSTGFPAALHAGGSGSLSANDLVLYAGPVPDAPGVIFYGANRMQVPFGDGFRCVGGSLVRSPALVGTSLTLTWALDLSDPAHGAITAGSTPHFQALFRDVAAGGSGFNLSSGLTVTFGP